ncbi:uncharacterized protein TrAFT101_001071 [Trichoderma asperellum]|uniref:uncharacterized protein n=1 Tax=Trichoderma asperellum TaxID=101201 RepID=UPI003330DC58|nr:hypothetical protein TrAFT101_001071 [Trichoderma asperellum]
MPNLTDSHEWFLLRELAEWLSQRKAQYHALPINEHREIHFDAELLEFELRHTFFTIQKFPQSLSLEKFISCQGLLKQLCSLLNRLAARRRAHDGSQGQDYPHLEALIGLLNPTCETIDLVNGLKQRLFEVPGDTIDLRDYLTAVTKCNDDLNRLLPPPPLESVIQPSRKERKKTPWKKGKTRDQALCVLETLFKHFKCGIPHEVLLKLIENTNEDLVVSNLQLMLPSCPELKSWQEVQYANANLDDASISLIHNICTDVQQYKGMALMLHIKGHKLYSARANPGSSRAGPSSKESLDQLIKNGAFKSINAGDFNTTRSSSRFSIRDKRKLAVKFGYYLMDFFDADFASNRIHFFDSSKPSRMEIPYLAFSSKFPITGHSYSFKLGHPTFLSFAKLLIELELGGIIELEVSPDSEKNFWAWAELMRFVDDLEKERKDSYREAITNCLLFHKMIDASDFDDKDADSNIRRLIYEQIVYKLELGLDESSPRSPHKRQRSESPPASDLQGTAQTAHSWNMTILSMAPQPASHRNKRHRGSELLQQQSQTSFESPPDGFEIALLCALQIESDAVEALFDEYYEDNFSYEKAAGDPNAYTIGKMAGHNVVLAFMSGMGKVNSANAAAGVCASFPNIKLGIVVGVCGGVPDGAGCEKEVLLGDVIISNAVIQYDFGRQNDNRSVRRDTLQHNLGRPNPEIRAFLKKLDGLRGRRMLKEKTSSYLEDLCARDDFKESSYPGAENDILHHPTYRHKHRNPDVCSVCASCEGLYDDVCDEALESSCADLGCQDSMAISRARVEKAKGATTSRGTPTDEELREAQKPFIHFGTVVSGDLVMKSGHHRDEIAKREGAIAFEMEGAGVWDSFPTVVIKSVCDYADSHKNKMWQKYAAASAAACTKAFLGEWRKTC